MSVSPISGITIEGQPLELSSFMRSGVVYVVWILPITETQRRLFWKPHSAANFTEVAASLVTTYRNITALYHQPTDSIAVAWDTGRSVAGRENSDIYTARFNVSTGQIISGPTLVGPGTRPQLTYKNNVAGDVLYLFSFLAKTDGVTVRISLNGGLSFGDAAPVLTNKVLKTSFVEAVAYDDGHISITQLGSDSRPLFENGMLKRTRPLSHIIRHPTNSNQLFVGEPSRITSVAQADNLRGGLCLSTDNTTIYKIDGDSQGTSDSVGGIARLTVTGTSPAVTASDGPNPGASRNRIVSYSLNPTATATADLDVGLPAVSLSVSSNYAYLAQYLESNPTAGQLRVVQLSSLTTQSAFLTGVSGRAVAVANFFATPVIFAATTESSVERLRVYTENGTSPTLVATFKLLARANGISVAPHPQDVSWAYVYVSTDQHLAFYEYTGPSNPLRLLNTVPNMQFYSTAIASNGNVVAACGNRGVSIISPSGKTLAQTVLSGEVIPEWTPSTSYTLNTLVRPRAVHQFAQNRYYFTCTLAGTSGAGEPFWDFSGTVFDASCRWQAVGSIDGIVTGVVIDEPNKRIYAVGVAGGNAGTDGRVWVLSARGFL